jgi:hypothetical protein
VVLVVVGITLVVQVETVLALLTKVSLVEELEVEELVQTLLVEVAVELAKLEELTALGLVETDFLLQLLALQLSELVVAQVAVELRLLLLMGDSAVEEWVREETFQLQHLEPQILAQVGVVAMHHQPYPLQVVAQVDLVLLL